eukprot:COSAG02_NODE_597_length_19775_cov_28.914312_10_plen_91_part_00
MFTVHEPRTEHSQNNTMDVIKEPENAWRITMLVEDNIHVPMKLTKSVRYPFALTQQAVGGPCKWMTVCVCVCVCVCLSYGRERGSTNSNL